MPYANRPAPVAQQPQVWMDLINQQQSILQQLQRQQQDWLHGWFGWMQQMTSPQQTQTVSRLIEQEFDLMTRFVRFMGEQTRNFAQMQEHMGEQEQAAFRRIGTQPAQVSMSASWQSPQQGQSQGQGQSHGQSHGRHIKVSGPDESDEGGEDRHEAASKKAKPASSSSSSRSSGSSRSEKEESSSSSRGEKEESGAGESKH
jgi:hypothetical protein